MGVDPAAPAEQGRARRHPLRGSGLSEYESNLRALPAATPNGHHGRGCASAHRAGRARASTRGGHRWYHGDRAHPNCCGRGGRWSRCGGEKSQGGEKTNPAAPAGRARQSRGPSGMHRACPGRADQGWSPATPIGPGLGLGLPAGCRGRRRAGGAWRSQCARQSRFQEPRAGGGVTCGTRGTISPTASCPSRSPRDPAAGRWTGA